MAKPQIILLGAPGSGKGTQAAKIVELGYYHVSTGDLLRAEIKKASNLGKKIQDLIGNGQLVDDQTVLDLLQANINLAKGEYIFDGFPRTEVQATMLDKQIVKKAKAVAIYLDVSLDELVSRIVNRRTCGGCNEIYNLINKPPKKEGVCDLCGKGLVHRKDDNKETVQNRMDVFKEQIDPILAYYETKGMLKKVDASINPDTTFKQIRKIVES
ncbi:MAG: hypothetical protein A2202_03345 [Bdellovibrionales bacterium RIFOXYA1_FULL_36_14]|nr:MAG: hypothetical protein A2202_03345 [Bdellovibrionales bacterium RIFOXYA1_FULL_36_14]